MSLLMPQDHILILYSMMLKETERNGLTATRRMIVLPPSLPLLSLPWSPHLTPTKEKAINTREAQRGMIRLSE
jgi:hypothetical protein